MIMSISPERFLCRHLCELWGVVGFRGVTGLFVNLDKLGVRTAVSAVRPPGRDPGGVKVNQVGIQKTRRRGGEMRRHQPSSSPLKVRSSYYQFPKRPRSAYSLTPVGGSKE
jgi:hypothetical protein